jgi:hypothetical protein
MSSAKKTSPSDSFSSSLSISTLFRTSVAILHSEGDSLGRCTPVFGVDSEKGRKRKWMKMGPAASFSFQQLSSVQNKTCHEISFHLILAYNIV